MARAQDKSLHLRILRRPRINHSLCLHCIQHDGLSLLRRDEVHERRDLGRCIRNTRKHGRFGQIECSGGRSKVPVGCRLYALKSAPIVDDIQIHFEDLLL